MSTISIGIQAESSLSVVANRPQIQGKHIFLLFLLKPTVYFSHDKVALQESASGMQHVRSCLERNFNNENR